MCLERRDLIALEWRDGRQSLLAASDVLVETFVLAEKLGTFTAMNVAERLNITAPNANNRLKRLVSARALIRETRVAERGGSSVCFRHCAVPTFRRAEVLVESCQVHPRIGQFSRIGPHDSALKGHDAGLLQLRLDNLQGDAAQRGDGLRGEHGFRITFD